MSHYTLQADYAETNFTIGRLRLACEWVQENALVVHNWNIRLRGGEGSSSEAREKTKAYRAIAKMGSRVQIIYITMELHSIPKSWSVTV